MSEQGADMSSSEAGVAMDGDIELVPTGPPRALKATFWATVVWSALSLVAVFELFAERPYLRKTLIDNNNKATKPIANYTGHVVDNAVQKSLIIGVVVTLLVVVILLLLAQLAWRGRPWARWALIAMATVPGVFFGVGVIGQLAFGTLQSSPGVHKLLTVLAGIASLVVIVLLVDKETRGYFAAVRDTKRGILPPVTERPRGARGARAAARPARAASPGATASTAGAPTGATAAWAPRSGGLGALFRKSVGPAPAPADVSSADSASATTAIEAGAPSADRPGGTPSRRSSATRPGSVKAKGGGTRPGRSKSRQQ